MKQTPSVFPPGRRLEILDDPIHDPYQARMKLAGPAVCAACGAVYADGRWHWGTLQAGARVVTCPACQRIAERQPAGYVTVAAELSARHHDAILSVVRHAEARDNAEHPLQRVMGLDEADGALCITTTDPHLAQGLGTALARAFHAHAEFSFAEAEHLARVHVAP